MAEDAETVTDSRFSRREHMIVLGRGRRLLLGALLCMAFTAMTAMAALAATYVDIEWPTHINTFDRAMQSALDDAHSRDLESGGDGSVIYRITAPAGTYSIYQCMDVYSNTYIDLTGVTLKRAHKASFFRFGRDAEVENISGYDGFKNVTFNGGTFDGAKATNTNSSFIRWAHAQNITLQNVTMKDINSGHYIEFAASKNVKIKNCTFDGYHKKSTSNDEAIQIECLHPKHFAKYGKYDYTNCKSVTITGCTFKNVQRGVGTHAAMAGIYMEKIKIENNTFENIPGYAIIANNYVNSSIKNNKIKKVGAGIMFCNWRQTLYGGKSSAKISKVNNKSVISGNTIEVVDKKYSNVPYGIQLYGLQNKKATKEGAPAGNYRVQNVTVEKNKITMKNTGYGIWNNGGSSNKIRNNTITLAVPKKISKTRQCSAIRMQDGKKNKVTGNTMVNKSKHKTSKSFKTISVPASDKNKVVYTQSGNKATGFSV